MADGQWGNFPSISRTDFERALQIWLDGIEKQSRKDKGWFSSTFGGIIPWVESPAEFTDALYNEVMDMVDVMGVGPWIPNFDDIVSFRVQRFNEEEMAKQAEQAAQELLGHQEWLQEFGLRTQQFELDKARESRISGDSGWERQLSERQFELQQQELAMRSSEQAQKAWELQQANRANALSFETQRIGTWQLGQQDLVRRQEQERLYREFEDMRAQIGSSLAPRDWVIRAKAQSAVNPFAPQGAQAQFQEDVDVAKDRLQTYEKMKKESSDEVKNAARQLQEITKVYLTNPSEQAYELSMNAAKNAFDTAVEAAKMRSEQLDWRIQGTKSWLQQAQGSEEGQLAEQWAAPRATGVGTAEVGLPNPVEWQKKVAKPGLPGEIKNLVQGGEFGGEVITPSGQAWSALSPAGREALYGYAESLGQYPQNITWQMQQQLPQNPSMGRRWQPARARV